MFSLCGSAEIAPAIDWQFSLSLKMETVLTASGLKRWALLRSLFEIYCVPLDMLSVATGLKMRTLAARAEREGWCPGHSIETLHRRFLSVCQNCVDELETAPDQDDDDQRREVRIKLLQNLSKTLETALSLDGQLRNRQGPLSGQNATGTHESAQREQAHLDEKLAKLLFQLVGEK